MSRFDVLLQREMSRKQFLVVLGTAMISIFGLSSITGLFTKADISTSSAKPGYGLRDYGP